MDRVTGPQNVGRRQRPHFGVIAIVGFLDEVDGRAVGKNHADLVAKGEIDRRRADLVVSEGLDDEPARVELGQNGFAR